MLLVASLLAGVACTGKIYVTPTPTPASTPATPAAPTLMSPRDGASLATTRIVFQWSASSGATKYALEVNTDQNWGTATRFCYAAVTTNSVIVAGFPANGTKYYWHVSAGNYYGWSPASTTSSVVNGTQGGAPTATPTSSLPADGSASPPTAAPSLLSPPNGATVIGNPVTFTWNPVSGATKYLLKVFRPDGSQVIAVDVGGVTTYTATSLPYHVSDFTYYWAVWAGNGAGWCADAAALANQCQFTQMYR